MLKMAAYLEVDGDIKGHIMKNLIIPGSEIQDVNLSDNRSQGQTVHPEPGFCVKVKTLDGDKVFINICHSGDLPAPKDITEDDLISILESDNPSSFKVPLSLGDAHIEKDKSNKSCTAYDVIINKDFFNRIENNILFKTFVVTVAMEGLETKHDLELSKQDYVILKNKRYLGALQSVKIKSVSNPLVAEYEGPLKPKFEMRYKRSEKTLNIKIQLPEIKSVSDIVLDLNDDHLILHAKSQVEYLLDIFTPVKMDPNKASAVFDCGLQIINIVTTVVSES